MAGRRWLRLVAGVLLAGLAVTVGALNLTPGFGGDDPAPGPAGDPSAPPTDDWAANDRTRESLVAIFDAVAASWDETRTVLVAVPGDSAIHLREATAGYARALTRAAEDLQDLAVPDAVRDDVMAVVALLHDQQVLLSAALDALADGDDAGFAGHLTDLSRSTTRLATTRSELVRALSA